MKKIEIALNNGKRFTIFEIKDENIYHTKIKKLNNLKEIGIYYVDSERQQDEKIGNIIWPPEIEQGDIIISFNPNEKIGELQIAETSYIWSYDIKDVVNEKNQNNVVIDTQAVLKTVQKKEEKNLLHAEDLIVALNAEIFGQEEGIRKISEIIASNWNRKEPKVTVILLMGSTGVGKSQIAKNIPKVLSEKTDVDWGLQIVAMNELVEDHYASRLFSSPPGYVGYGQPSIFEAIRKNPYQLYLLDEIEKTAKKIWVALMEALDTGVVHMADNSEDIDLSHCVVIMTSNLKIDMEAYNKATPFMRKEMCRDIIARNCGYPEIAGRIPNCLVFQDLSDDAKLEIIRKTVEQELDDFDMQVGHIDSALAAELLQVMKHTNYGARAIKDAVRTALVTYTAYKHEIEKYQGKTVTLFGSMDCIHLGICA